MTARRRSEPSRIEALSDGVFAFALTLLVVSLEVPGTLDELLADLSGFGAFAVSFGALMLIWAVHNGFFRRYGLQDEWTMILNGCLLFVVLFYVFPLKFVAAGLTGHIFGFGDYGRMPAVASLDELSTLFLLYSLGFVLIFVFVSLMYAHAARKAEPLRLDDVELHEANMLKRHYAIFVLVGLVSISVTLLGVWVEFGFPGWIYTLLGPLCWLHGTWSERRCPTATSGRVSSS